jgi:ADP-ribosylglycohydrolase
VKKIKSKILGSLVAGAIGDAMGAATEQMTMDQILERYGGFVDRFYKPGEDRPFSGGRKAGEITDDTGQMMELLEEFIKAGKEPITPQAVADSLIRWAEDPELFERFAGPTTRQAIERLRKGEDPISVGMSGGVSTGTSNGCAMKIAPAGLFHPGDLDKAVNDACTVCRPTHATQIAMSGASAVAAGIAEALTDNADVFSVVEACKYGAKAGEKIGKKLGRIVCGPSVLARIKFAVMLAIDSNNLEEACRKISAYVGSGIPVAEAVPAAIGLFVAAGGDPMKTISAASTIGDDTDTVAIIAGVLAGALSGFEGISNNLYRQLEEVNDLKLKQQTEKIYNILTSTYPEKYQEE